MAWNRLLGSSTRPGGTRVIRHFFFKHHAGLYASAMPTRPPSLLIVAPVALLPPMPPKVALPSVAAEVAATDSA